MKYNDFFQVQLELVESVVQIVRPAKTTQTTVPPVKSTSTSTDRVAKTFVYKTVATASLLIIPRVNAWHATLTVPHVLETQQIVPLVLTAHFLTRRLTCVLVAVTGRR